MPSSLGELAAALVAIDSVNPALVPGGAGEREIASFVADWCAGTGSRSRFSGTSARASSPEARLGRRPLAAS